MISFAECSARERLALPKVRKVDRLGRERLQVLREKSGHPQLHVHFAIPPRIPAEPSPNSPLIIAFRVPMSAL